jgi:hypothetical protein
MVRAAPLLTLSLFPSRRDIPMPAQRFNAGLRTNQQSPVGTVEPRQWVQSFLQILNPILQYH